MNFSGKTQARLYANVIMPLKFRDYVTYAVPEEMIGSIKTGSIIKAKIKNTSYTGVVAELTETPGFDPKRVIRIEELEPLPPIRESEITFWKAISKYYMCSIGEVYKAASPYSLKPSVKKKTNADDIKAITAETEENTKTSQGVKRQETGINTEKINPLSDDQVRAYTEIKDAFGKKKTVLLKGVTGSGKTEIYIHLIKECLEKGMNALYLLPEVAVSRQLSHRLEKVFGSTMAIYHSSQTIAKRKRIISELASQTVTGNNSNAAAAGSAQNTCTSPKLILGLRSSLFLPYANIGLIIIDEEHDSSYKQSDPAPRYNGRDSAIMLGQIHGANILLGSATPSFESEYNVLNGKYTEVLLNNKYHDADDARILIVDMLKARRQRALKGLFSLTLIKEIQQRLDSHEQVMVFRSRRAYSSIVQCEECGEIPKCPHCNTRLTYHKFNGRLSCHYCGYSRKFGHCPSCGADAMKFVGAGTERVEEELRSLFPNAAIARFDADTAKSSREGEKILRSFAKGETDILVGTQMLSKGFDFGNLTLVAVIQGESILAIHDFRADEKAVQLLNQLKGRAGRREKIGTMLIQTSQMAHPVYGILTGETAQTDTIFAERKEFDFPPFVRMLEISIKDKYADRCERTARKVEEIIKSAGITGYSGPIAPPIDKIQGENILQFIIKLKRDKQLEKTKADLYAKISSLEEPVVINVDPL